MDKHIEENEQERYYRLCTELQVDALLNRIRCHDTSGCLDTPPPPTRWQRALATAACAWKREFGGWAPVWAAVLILYIAIGLVATWAILGGAL